MKTKHIVVNSTTRVTARPAIALMAAPLAVVACGAGTASGSTAAVRRGAVAGRAVFRPAPYSGAPYGGAPG